MQWNLYINEDVSGALEGIWEEAPEAEPKPRIQKEECGMKDNVERWDIPLLELSTKNCESSTRLNIFIMRRHLILHRSVMFIHKNIHFKLL